MDLFKIIGALVEERNRIDRIIRSIEMAASSQSAQSAYNIRKIVASPGNRGRKSMDAAERRVVAERMRRYWASRREARREARPEDETNAAGASTPSA